MIAALSADRYAHSSVIPFSAGVKITRRSATASRCAACSSAGSVTRSTARLTAARNWVAVSSGARPSTADSTVATLSTGRERVASTRTAACR